MLSESPVVGSVIIMLHFRCRVHVGLCNLKFLTKLTFLFLGDVWWKETSYKEIILASSY